MAKFFIVGGGDPPMARFIGLLTLMTLYWFQRRERTKRLWSSSGMKFLSLLYCFSSVVSHGQMNGNISIY